MKLRELRNWLRDYELTWYAHKLSGEHNAALYVRQYLKPFFNKPEEYELSIADLYKLITHIPIHSKLPLVSAIKNNVNLNYFFDIFIFLEKHQLSSPANFQIIYELSSVGREFLYHLLCHERTDTQWIKLTAPILASALNVAMQLTACDKSAIRCFKLLNKINYCQLGALRAIELHEDRLSLLQLFKLLIRNKCMNDAALRCINQLNFLSTSSMLLHLLEDSGQITIDNDLIELLLAHQYKEYILELVVVLANARGFVLTSDLFSYIMKQSDEFFYYKVPLIKSLQQHDALNNKLFQLILDQQDDLILQKIFDILAACSLLKDNEKLIAALIEHDKNRHLLYPILNYLQRINVLDNDLLISVLGQVWEKRPQAHDYDVFGLYLLFQANNLLLTTEQYRRVSTMSKADVPRLHHLVTNLIAYKQLDGDSFLKALELVTNRLPPVEAVTLIKKSRKRTGLARSELIIDRHLLLFSGHGKPCEKGSYGKVKELYDSIDAKIPAYGVKKLKEINPFRATQEASREVKYNRFLGRKAYFFWRNGRAHVVAEWQHEKAIHLFNKHELMRVSIEQRLKCLSSGLADLNRLHEHYRVHNDVKCHNFVLDLERASMKLIDFGAAHKSGSEKPFAYTPAYQDPAGEGEGFSQDMYGMGFVTMSLFPELYTVTVEPETHVTINKKLFTHQEEAILYLVDSMTHGNSSLSCTSKAALSYCDQLLKQLHNLDNASLMELISSILQPKQASAADIFCDYLPKHP